jgi:ribosomal protein S18 acetylase RimI-like enzyme
MPGPKILTFDAKWSPENPAYLSSTPVCPAEVSEEMRRRIEELSLAAYKAVGAPPYARVDLRCDDHERPYVLEVNPNPDLSPEAGLALQAGVAGMCYGELVKSIVGMADAECHSKIRLRPMIADDVERLAQITADTGFFRTDEIEVAREVLTDAASGDDSGYDVRVACNDDGIMGYVCFGATPLTRATWDIYWLAVAPDHQRKGVGRRLMRFAEEQIALKQGRLILVETSSQELYEPTRKFYESLGYEEVSRIADFYDTGDAKVTFGKVLSG